jgi:hypothetical protein
VHVFIKCMTVVVEFSLPFHRSCVPVALADILIKVVTSGSDLLHLFYRLRRKIVLEYRNRYVDGSHSFGEGNQGAPLAGVSALCFQIFCIIGPVSCGCLK